MPSALPPFCSSASSRSSSVAIFLSRKERPHDLHLGVEDKGRHQEQKAVGQGDGPLQVEEGGQEHEGAAGELEHQNIEPQAGRAAFS